MTFNTGFRLEKRRQFPASLKQLSLAEHGADGPKSGHDAAPEGLDELVVKFRDLGQFVLKPPQRFNCISTWPLLGSSPSLLVQPSQLSTWSKSSTHHPDLLTQEFAEYFIYLLPAAVYLNTCAHSPIDSACFVSQPPHPNEPCPQNDIRRRASLQ